MGTTTTDFVTVEMRGLKAALVARAASERVSVSVIVRRAVQRELGVASYEGPERERVTSGAHPRRLKLSMRVGPHVAAKLALAARRAGRSRDAYFADLVLGVPLAVAGASRSAHVAALTASNAELSTLSRNVHHLTALLIRGDSASARPYRLMLDTMSGQVRAHLLEAGHVLAAMRPVAAD